MKVSSPCNGICRLAGGDLCAGCHRSKDEIARWRQMSDSEKSAVISALAERGQAGQSGGDHG